MNAHADMLIVVKHNEKYIPRGIYRFLALGYETLQDFNAPKQALINAFLICLLPSASDVRHPSAQVHGAKVVNYFELSKKNCFLGQFWFRERSFE